MLELYKDLIGFTTTVSTIIQFLMGTVICRLILRNRSVGQISGVPFLAGVLGCSLWLRYGLILQDLSLEIVNGVGLTLQLIYCLVYYTYSIPKGPFQRQMAIVLMTIILTCSYVTWEPNKQTAQYRLGLLCCAANIVFCAAPLASLGDVLRSKSTENLPFHLILANVVVNALWWLYGICIHDTFVQIPSLIGCLIAACQLGLFFVYPSSSKSMLPV